MSSLYPTRDRNYTKATELRLEDDGRRHVYGKQNKSLLVQHAYPELLNQNNSKYYNVDNNNNNNHSSSSSSTSHPPNSWSSIGIKQYQIIRKVGSGTYGSVFYAQSPHGRDVAIKQLSPMQNEKQLQDGFHITAIREIKILKSLHHTNIISLHDVICDKENVMSDYNEAMNPNSSQSKKDKHLTRMYKDKRMQTYMIFEYMHHDLSGLLQNEAFTKLITVSTIKYFMCQILNALQYCHETALILHRDIKSSNLLVDHHGVVKIADFGLARQFIPELQTSNERIAQRHESINNHHCQYRRQYTNRVVTLWYRAPELLLSDQHYTPAVDLWSVGCVFAELLFNKPIFQGKNEMEQWFQIVGICGWDQKREQQWMSHLHDNHGLIGAMKKKSITFNRRLKQKFKQFTKKEAMNDNKYLDENGFRLLDSLLTINPFKRCSAAKARESEWFKNHPFPEPPKLKHLQSSHDYEQRQARKNPNYKKQQQQLNHNNHLYQHKNNNMNHNNNNTHHHSNNNMNNNRRYQYSYGGYQNNTHSNTTNNRYNPHNPHNGNNNNNYTRNHKMNDRNRSRSRSRSRERHTHKPMVVDNRSRSGSFDKHKKDNSVSLPPPMPRLPSLHGQNNNNNVAPMVVTLQAPSLNSNSSKTGYNNNMTNNSMNNNSNIVNNNINNGYKPQWKNGYNADATFYSRFKKPDELKGRSRF